MPVYGAGSKYLGRTEKETEWLRFHAPQPPAIPIAPLHVPTSYHEVTFDAVATLSYPHDVTKRINWQPTNLAEIARFEGVPLSVVGLTLPPTLA
jgi:hypothetical protein